MAVKAFATLALLVAYGPSLLRAQELYVCDRNVQPNWDDCELVVSQIDWTTGVLEGEPQVQPGVCSSWSSGNCLVQACNSGDQPRPMNTFNGQARYVILRSNCEKDKAGGTAPGYGTQWINILNNPSSAVADASGDLVTETMTIAASEALIEEAKMDVENSILSARQDPGEWTTIGLTNSVTTSERTRLSSAGVGTGQQWTVSEGYSVGISSTVEVGGSFFEIFSASVSLAVTEEFSQSYSETLTFNPEGKCDPDQTAILYMYPLFDKYVGFYSNDQATTVEWYIPVAPPLNTHVEVECLG